MMNAKPSILFTNISALARSGSELHMLQLAQAFVAKGWDVTCFVLLKGYPLQPEFEEQGIRLLDYTEIDCLEDHYDVLFAQHHIVSDYVWYCGNATFDKVIISSLGPQTDHEKLPSFSPQADLFLFITPEVKEARKPELNEFGISFDDERIVLFPNYATTEFFEKAKQACNEKLEKVAVVSNHVPEEISKLEDTAPFKVDVFGYETVSIELTPELLAGYDCIMSIGRTAQLSFALKVPYYCYDIFGGPGYTLPEEWKLHAEKNFSGRSNQKKLTAEELSADLLSRYDEARQNVDAFYDIAMKEFNFDLLFAGVYERIESLECKKHSHCAIESEKVKLARLCMLEAGALDSYTAIGQIFYGEGLSEHCETFKYRLNSLIEKKLPVGSGERFRFDPADCMPVITTIDSKCDSSRIACNATFSEGKDDVFYYFDPLYEMQRGETELIFCSKKVNIFDMYDKFKWLNEIESSTSWKVTKPLRAVSGIFKH